MRFGAYLTERGIKVQTAARELRRNVETIRVWVKGTSVPRKAEVEAIYVWSGFAVGPEDWYDLPKLDETEAARVADRDSGATA